MKNNLCIFRFVIGMLTVFIVLTACSVLSDVRSNTYENYEAVVAAGEIERGWVPEFLPQSSANIYVKYKVDANVSILAFNFAADDLEMLTQACTPTEEVPEPPLNEKWWSDDLLTSHGTFFRCEDDGYLVVDGLQGYYWFGYDLPY